LKLILGKGVVMAGVGIVAGMIFSAATASLMASRLYGVRPHDLVVFLIVPLLLFAVALLFADLQTNRYQSRIVLIEQVWSANPKASGFHGAD
jgi:hypothetical protein